MVVVDSALLVDPQSSWTGLDPDSDGKKTGFYFLNSGSDHPDFRRHCLIPWSQVLPHTLVPGTASYPGPKYCLIFWSQVLPMRVQKIKKEKWVQTGPGRFHLT